MAVNTLVVDGENNKLGIHTFPSCPAVGDKLVVKGRPVTVVNRLWQNGQNDQKELLLVVSDFE